MDKCKYSEYQIHRYGYFCTELDVCCEGNKDEQKDCLIAQLENKCEKYEKALNKIKAICNKTCQICRIFKKCEKEYSTCKTARLINIIDKAKDGNNE